MADRVILEGAREPSEAAEPLDTLEGLTEPEAALVALLPAVPADPAEADGGTDATGTERDH